MTNGKSRRKGMRFENTICNILREWGLTVWHRGQAGGGRSNAEIVVEEKPLSDAHIEAKDLKRIAAFRFLEQAARDARPGEFPMVIMKELRSPEAAMMYLDDLKWLVELAMAHLQEIKND